MQPDVQEQQSTECSRKFTLYLRAEENATLEQRQAEYGVTKSEQIRRAIRKQYLDVQEPA